VNKPLVVTIARACASAAIMLVRREVTPSGYGCNKISHEDIASDSSSSGSLPVATMRLASAGFSLISSCLKV
jgi:hypothetical protein